jgi:hypothetical protein
MIWWISIFGSMMVMGWLREIPFTCEMLQKESERWLDALSLPILWFEKVLDGDDKEMAPDKTSLWWRLQYHILEEVRVETQRMNMSICITTLHHIEKLLANPLFAFSASALLVFLFLPFITIILYIPWIMTMILVFSLLLHYGVYKIRYQKKETMHRE